MRSYPVKENLIGSAVSEILRYKQIDRQANRHRSTLYYRLSDIRRNVGIYNNFEGLFWANEWLTEVYAHFL